MKKKRKKENNVGTPKKKVYITPFVEVVFVEMECGIGTNLTPNI